ncbi:cell wall-binding repeat-containing protein [Robertmurraya sp. GLU-23]
MNRMVVRLLGLFILVVLLFPTAAFAEKVLVIDPGHGGRFTGTCGYTKESPKDLCERDVNLSVGLKIRDYLRSSGITVKMTREADVDFATYLSGTGGDFERRMQIANGYAKNNNDNSVFVSIHHNASPTSPFVKGYETYYYDGVNHFQPDWPHDPLQIKYLKDNQRLAQSIHSPFVSNLGMIDRKIHNDQSFYVIRNAQMPAVLLELGYMTNRDEESRIISADFQNRAAQSIANSIIEYFRAFDVYKDGQKVETFKVKTDAINYASKLSGFVQIFDKDSQSFIWENSNYEVYHKSTGLLKGFATYEQALGYANGTADTRIVHKATGNTVWSNFFSANYEVQQTNTNEKNVFFDFNEAVSFASNKVNTRIVRKDTNEILWTNLPEGLTKSVNQKQVSGETRYSTSVAVSKELYPNGFAADKQQKVVLLSTGEDAADALSAGPLTSRYDNAPILLNNSRYLLDEVQNELTRLGARKVVVLGGPQAISTDIENKIKSLGIEVERIQGATRIETNNRITEKLGDVNGVFVASARSYPDALAAAPIAAANNWGIVLTEKDKLSDAALNYMRGKKIVILGGVEVLPWNIESQILSQNSQQNVVRLAGATRFETLANMLFYFKEEMKSDTINISTGMNFPDALAAAPLSYANKAPLVLVGPTLNKNVESFLFKYVEENSVNQVKVVGGPMAVSDTMKNILVNKVK